MLPWFYVWVWTWEQFLFEMPFSDACSRSWRGRKKNKKKQMIFSLEDGKNTWQGFNWRGAHFQTQSFWRRGQGSMSQIRFLSAAKCCSSFRRASLLSAVKQNVMLIYFYAAVGNTTHTGSMLPSHGCCTSYQIYNIQLNRSSSSLQMNTSS